MEGSSRFVCPPPYIRTIPGILKIVEMVFAILTFACSFGGYWSPWGGGWVEFTGISCLITIAIWFILHMLGIVPQIFVNFLIELITYCVMTIMFLISGIVAAARAQELRGWAYVGSIGAASFFAFASMIVCGVDVVMQYLEYKRGTTSHTTATTTTVTNTTTSSSSAVRVEY